MIKTPVRYDSEHHHIFEADGNSLCWLTRNTHHPEWHLKDEAGQEIADAINSMAQVERLGFLAHLQGEKIHASTVEISKLRAALDKAEKLIMASFIMSTTTARSRKISEAHSVIITALGNADPAEAIEEGVE